MSENLPSNSAPPVATANARSTATPNASSGKLLPFARRWAILSGAIAGLILRLIFMGAPGERYAPMGTAFVAFVPLAVGAITVYLAERIKRRTWTYYLAAGAAATSFFVLGSLFILIEGLICAIVIIPVFAAYGALGALIMGAICRMTDWPTHAAYGFVALPLLLGAIPSESLEETSLRTAKQSVVIDAKTALVWQQLLNTPAIEANEMHKGWMYRIGVPLPQSATTQTSERELVRTITMGKGIRFDQVSIDWSPEKHVRWTYRFDKNSFPKGALDDHVTIGGRYFDVIDTVYTLEALPNGKTRLSTSMSYRVTTEFNWYANPVGDLLVENFEKVALEMYKKRAESVAIAR
jgi:hypothetical protein